MSDGSPARRLRCVRVAQPPVGPVVGDVAAAAAEACRAIGVDRDVRPGDAVALTGGSRGISDVVTVLAEVVARVRAAGGQPFLVPAMGSHGGGTAEGQVRVLASLGMTEDALACPIVADGDTVEVATSTFGVPLVVDRRAATADHVVVVNRVKPHTGFTGRVESGIAKMLTIGLGGHRGAATAHRTAIEHGWDALVADAVPRLVAGCNVLGGVAIVERSDERTARVVGVPAGRILEDEAALLDDARRWLPRLPFAEVDLALVDRIGKDISGTGLDVNVVGRKRSLHAHHPDPSAPVRIRHLAVRGLTAATEGNALGIGLAEMSRTRVLEQADWETTRVNALTSADLAAAMVPLAFPTDAAIVDASLALAGLRAPERARVVWMRDTLHLDEVVASTALVEDAVGPLDVRSEPAPLPFDRHGDLPDDLPEDWPEDWPDHWPDHWPERWPDD